MKKKTQMIHGGHTTDDFTGAVTTPIYQTSTYLQDEIGDLRQGYEYSRTANPTRTAIESVIANLENGKHGFAFGSGMAAISAVIMLLDKGDHLILNSDVYGGTYRALTKVFTVILAVIAAVIDLTITISSPMYELNETNPTLSRKALFQSGMRVGREILATSANTIYLAYFGGQLTLFFWFFQLHYSFGHIINSKIFAQEFISILLGGIAVAISIPITAWITALLIKHPKFNQKHSEISSQSTD